MTLATVCCCITLLTSCSFGNPDEPVIPKPDSEQGAAYTILYYGHGGSNRESFYLQKIADFYNASPDALKRVNVVVQYKFSTADNLKEQAYFGADSCQLYGSKTIRWAVDPEKTFREQAYDPASIYGADNAEHSSADSLASFINWEIGRASCRERVFMMV